MSYVKVSKKMLVAGVVDVLDSKKVTTERHSVQP
jgi:hypothetical protein